MSVDKLSFFKQISFWNNKCQENAVVNIPEWTTNKQEAVAWNTTFLARTKLNGHSGQGIFVCEPNDEVLPHAPLYVKYKKKRHEYRVHVFNGQVIDVTQKKRKKGFEGVDNKIRNHKNGWIYARDDVTEPNDLRTQALNTINAVGLKFGAVDLIWNEKENKCYVLEVNTAPGLYETTLRKYAEAFVKDITQ